MVRASFVTVLAACSTPIVPAIDAGVEPVTTETWTGGTRLEAQVVSDGAGGEALLGWFDTMLQARCYFLPASDGQLRCVPFPTPLMSDTSYSDSSCTQRALVTYDACAPTHASRTESGVCPARRHVYPVGQALSQKHFFVGAPANCARVPDLATRNVYALGAEVPAVSLVAVTVTQASDGGIGLDRFSTSDGASGTLGLRDVTADDDCGVTTFSDGSHRCTPTNVIFGYGHTFADALCSTPAFSFGGPCPTPKFISNGGSGAAACELEPQYSRRGALLSTYYVDSSGTCEPLQSSPSDKGWLAGESLPPSAFTAATVSTTSLGRLERRVLVWPGGARTLDGWRDTELDTECSGSFPASDGSRRCIPFTPGVFPSGYFADAACTQALAQVEHDDASCAPKFVSGGAGGCAGQVRTWSVGARHTGAVFTGDTAACASSTAPAAALFLIGAELLPSSMAALSEATR